MRLAAVDTKTSTTANIANTTLISFVRSVRNVTFSTISIEIICCCCCWISILEICQGKIRKLWYNCYICGCTIFAVYPKIVKQKLTRQHNHRDLLSVVHFLVSPSKVRKDRHFLEPIDIFRRPCYWSQCNRTSDWSSLHYISMKIRLDL